MRNLKDRTLTIKTHYWRPGENFLQEISRSIKNFVEDGDIVTISEKALSIVAGNIVDEGKVKPGSLAHFIAKYWMRYIWGYLLSSVCHLKKKNIKRLRRYPVKEGTIHKQVVLRYVGFLQVLQWGSEGGIDGSNLPYSYVCLPLRDPVKTAEEIRRHIKNRLGKNVIVMIVDTDKTYSFGGFHFTPRPNPIKGIHSFGGFISYVFGRALKLKRRSTPLAVVGSKMDVNLALEIAETANRKRGSGAGRTVWDMAERFKVPLTRVTWSMLEKIEHKPIVIFKLAKSSNVEKTTTVST